MLETQYGRLQKLPQIHAFCELKLFGTASHEDVISFD
jgi:hypothetical protein